MRELLKILLTNYSEVTFPGGIHKTIVEIAKNLSEKGHEVVVLQPNPLNLLKEELTNGFKIIRVRSIFGKYCYGFCPEIYFFLRKHLNISKPDIVHIHGYHTLFSPLVIHFFKKYYPEIPIVFSPHFGTRGTLAGKYFFGIYNLLIGKKLVKSVERIIVSSEFEAKAFMHCFNFGQNKVSIVPHGVDVIDRGKFPKRWNEIRILYAGHLIKTKRVDDVLRSLYSLVYEMGVKDVLLTLIGEGPEKGKLLKLAKSLGINDKIKWKNFCSKEELIKEIKNADVLLLLSESENYGIIVAESLALGTPVIGTKITALKEFLNESGYFGVNYTPNPTEVAQLILEIVNNDVRVGQLSKRIRLWSDVAKDYEKIYLEILNGREIKCV